MMMIRMAMALSWFAVRSHPCRAYPFVTHPRPSTKLTALSCVWRDGSGPTVVLVSSLAFIGGVVLLHIWGKFSSRA
jgi:hypothetical protein